MDFLCTGAEDDLWGGAPPSNLLPSPLRLPKCHVPRCSTSSQGLFSERGLSLGHPIFALVPEEAEALGVPGKRRNGLLCLQDNEDARRNLWEEDDKIGGTWKPR